MKTKTVKIGSKVIGGGNPILIQSMTNTKTEDIAATVAQINKLAAAGCDIIRCAVPTMEAAEALTEIKKQVAIPAVSDIHFDYEKYYPIVNWTNKDCLSYIKLHKLPEPLKLGSKRGSSGINFRPETILYIKEHYPKDYKKII